MKQVSHPPFLGIGDDKWCPFFLFGHPKTHFFAPQINENGRFRVQKNWVLGRPNKKTGTTFRRQLYPKMVDETLVSYEYHYWVSFGQILKMAHSRLIFGRFPLLKSQNQNPMVLSVNF